MSINVLIRGNKGIVLIRNLQSLIQQTTKRVNVGRFEARGNRGSAQTCPLAQQATRRRYKNAEYLHRRLQTTPEFRLFARV